MRTLGRDNFIGTSDSTGRFKPSPESYGSEDGWFWDTIIPYQAYKWATGSSDEASTDTTPSQSSGSTALEPQVSSPDDTPPPARAPKKSKPRPESSWMDYALPIGAVLGVSGLVYLAWRYLPESK